MKEIEHLPAVVLSVLPCLTLCPREIRPRGTRPLGLDGCKATRRAKPPIGHALPVVGDDDLDEPAGRASGRFDAPRRDGDRAAVRHSIGRVPAEIQQSEVELFRVGIEGP